MKKLLSSVVVVCMVLFMSGAASAAVFEEVRFDGKPYNLDGNLWVLQETQASLSAADDTMYTLRLIALRPDGSVLNERFWFEVTPPSAGQSYIVELPEVSGYNPIIMNRKFVHALRDEVFLTVERTPGGSRYFTIVALEPLSKTREAVFLFDSRRMARAILSGDYIGLYKVMLHVYDTGTNATLDVSARKDYYQGKGIYDEKGYILQPLAVSAQRYKTVELGEVDSRGLHQLKTTIDLFGYDDSDHIATIDCVMSYVPEVGFWRVLSSKIVPDSDLKFWTR